MRAFTGQAQLHIDDYQSQVLLSLDPQAGSFEAEMLADAFPDDLFQFKIRLPKIVKLTNISVPLPTGTLTSQEIDNIYLGAGTLSTSITETPISRALNLSNDRSGIRRVTLDPKAPNLKFIHSPPLESKFELYFLNNFINSFPLEINFRNTIISFHQRKGSLSVTSESDIIPLLPRISAAWSILQGAYLFHSASYSNNGEVSLVVRRPRSYSSGNSLFRGWENLEPLATALLTTFIEKSDEDFDGWKKAINFYLEGRNSDLDYDVRIIGFMIFIEMFDEAKSMCKKSISNEFKCSIQFAEFIMRMRNKLIHERRTLWTATPEALNEILSHQPSWICPEINSSTGNTEIISLLFFLNLEKIINSYIINHVGHNGRYDDNFEMIESLHQSAN